MRRWSLENLQRGGPCTEHARQCPPSPALPDRSSPAKTRSSAVLAAFARTRRNRPSDPYPPATSSWAAPVGPLGAGFSRGLPESRFPCPPRAMVCFLSPGVEAVLAQGHGGMRVVRPGPRACNALVFTEAALPQPGLAPSLRPLALSGCTRASSQGTSALVPVGKSFPDVGPLRKSARDPSRDLPARRTELVSGRRRAPLRAGGVNPQAPGEQADEPRKEAPGVRRP